MNNGTKVWEAPPERLRSFVVELLAALYEPIVNDPTAILDTVYLLTRNHKLAPEQEQVFKA